MHVYIKWDFNMIMSSFNLTFYATSCQKLICYTQKVNKVFFFFEGESNIFSNRDLHASYFI